MLSHLIGESFFNFLNFRIKLNEFENWIYSSNELVSELKEGEYYELISFDFKQKDAFYYLKRIVKDILNNYQCIRARYISNICIQGICVTNMGNYVYMKQLENRHFKLTVGQPYSILSIDYEKHESGLLYCQYAIMDDDAMIYSIPSDLLRVDALEISEGWIIEQLGSGQLSIEPMEWNEKYYKGEFSFWEDFYDGKEHAIFEFLKVLQRMGIEIPERFYGYAMKLLEIS
jgi:hypothetical protein